jgi:hypothetical protein
VIKEDGSFINEAESMTGANLAEQQTSKIIDRSGRSAVISSTGEVIVGGRMDSVSINFHYGVSDDDIVNGGMVTGTGVLGQVGSMATVSPGTGVGSATLQSLRPVRYRPGHESYCSTSVVLAVPEINVNQYIGFLDAEDGLCFGYKGLDPGFWFIEGGNSSFYPKSEWNIDPMDGTGPSGYILNMQAGQVPVIKFVWHGIRNITLEIISESGEAYPCHVLKFINTATDTHLKNPDLPVSCKIERTAGTGAAVVLKTGSWRAGVIGFEQDETSSDRWKDVTVLDSILAGSVRNNIFTVRNKSTYAGKINHIVYELGITTLASDANKTVAIYATTDAVLSGNTAFVDVDGVNTPLEVSQGGTITGGERHASTVLRPGQDRRTDTRGTGIFIYPGTTLTIEVDSGGAVNGTFSASARFIGRH